MANSLVYYAMGGGLGHLARARALLHTLGYTGRVTLICASEHARDARVVGDWDVAIVSRDLERNPRAFARWISQTLAAVGADGLCVDAFPAGILGELSALRLPPLELWHVARRLRWSSYLSQVQSAWLAEASEREHAGQPRGRVRGVELCFDRTFLVEALEVEHERELRAHSRSVERLSLIDPPAPEVARLTAAAHWLVIHSGPVAEVQELLAYAAELRAREHADVELWVITPQPLAALPAATYVLNAYPAQSYLLAAARVVSAAGFNIMRQCAPYRAKHVVLPMPRRFDDQYERARQARAELGAAR